MPPGIMSRQVKKFPQQLELQQLDSKHDFLWQLGSQQEVFLQQLGSQQEVFLQQLGSQQEVFLQQLGLLWNEFL